MHEENDFAHVSRFKGRMHGCGHDGHTTMLLGAARYLAATRNFDGTVVPDLPAGRGRLRRRQGDDRRRPVRALSRRRDLRAAQLAGPAAGHRSRVRPGPMMAAADRIEIHIEGRGGHGAHPHLTVDPVLVAGHIITAAQSIVARNVSPIDTAVVSLCAMHAGNLARDERHAARGDAGRHGAHVPPATQDTIEQRLDRARAFDRRRVRRDGDAQVRARLSGDRQQRRAKRSSPPASPTRWSAPENVVRDLEPSMGSEDFSFMLQRRPGAYARLGQGGAEGGCFLHNSALRLQRRRDSARRRLSRGAGRGGAAADARSIAMNPADHFAQSYGEARDKFLAAAEARGARVSRHVHPSERGADRRGTVDRPRAARRRPMRRVCCC